MNILQFTQHKNKSKKIAMLTCYDYTSARILDATNIDGVLVGDSAAMVMHGHSNTLSTSTEMMIWHTQAVTRGINNNKFIVTDLPFLSHRQSISKTMKLVQKIIQAGAHAVKIEGARGNEQIIHHIVESGIPVMGHIGLTAQFYHQLGGFRVQGKKPEKAQELLEQALILEEAGCCSMVLECMPSDLAQEISNKLTIPTIGIGAGPYTDGQILVLQDVLGLSQDHQAKFVKAFVNGADLFKQAIDLYVHDIDKTLYPSLKEHCY